MVKDVLDDHNIRLLTRNVNGHTVLMTVSRNTDHIDMSLTVKHHLIVALKMLQNPSCTKLDNNTGADMLGVTLLDNTVASAVVLS